VTLTKKGLSKKNRKRGYAKGGDKKRKLLLRDRAAHESSKEGRTGVLLESRPPDQQEGVHGSMGVLIVKT